MKKIILVCVLVASALALADKSLGTCITSSAQTQDLHIRPAKDGGFDALACGTVFFADGGEVAQLRGLCAPCTASTFQGVAAACKTAYQSAYCP